MIHVTEVQELGYFHIYFWSGDEDGPYTKAEVILNRAVVRVFEGPMTIAQMKVEIKYWLMGNTKAWHQDAMNWDHIQEIKHEDLHALGN